MKKLHFFSKKTPFFVIFGKSLLCLIYKINELADKKISPILRLFYITSVIILNLFKYEEQCNDFIQLPHRDEGFGGLA